MLRVAVQLGEVVVGLGVPLFLLVRLQLTWEVLLMCPGEMGLTIIVPVPKVSVVVVVVVDGL
jgi:hypothetical protein